jgi:hypothetical protein
MRPTGAACAQVTLRPTTQVFTYPGTDLATVDGDVIRLGWGAHHGHGRSGECGRDDHRAVGAGRQRHPHPAGAGGAHGPMGHTRRSRGAELGALAGDTSRLQLPDTTVGWTPGIIARLNGVALAPIDFVESHVPVIA